MTKPPPLRLSVDEEIGELWSLADECREWAGVHGVDRPASEDVHRAMVNEFARLADRLDAIAKRLAARERA